MPFKRLALCAALAALTALASPFAANSQESGQSEFIFRYKAELIGVTSGVDCSADPEAEGCTTAPDCTADPEAEGCAPDCEADPEAEGCTTPALITDVTPDPWTPDVYQDGDHMQPLSLRYTDSHTTVGPDRIVWQCLAAEGGYGEYLWATTDISGDTSWVEAYDIVVKSKLHDPEIPNSEYLYNGSTFMVNPGLNEAFGGFPIDHSGEACVRIKVKANSARGDTTTISVDLDDHDPSNVLNDHLVEEAFYSASSYAFADIDFTPDCAGGCSYAPVSIDGADEINIEVGEDYLPWYAEGGDGNYTWSIAGVVDDISVVQSSGWKLRAAAPGVYENAILKVADGHGNTAQKIVKITVGTPRPGIVAWGQNNGTWGNGSTSGNGFPEEVYTLHDWDYLTANRVTCGIESETKDLYCWGNIGWGLLGMGPGVSQKAPNAPVEPAGGWTMVSPGSNEVNCGIRSGDLYCWGNSTEGALGLGSGTTSVQVPTLVSSGGWTTVSVGSRTACGIRNDDLYCWGQNSYSKLVGNNSSVDVFAPTKIGASGGWSKVDVSGLSACGIRSGSLYCWGDNSSGQLALGFTGGFGDSVGVPTQIANDPGSWTDISAGGNFACGLRGSEMRCWGVNYSGQLADGTTNGRNAADHVVPGYWMSVSTGDEHACGIQQGGGAYCWGSGSWGQLGLVGTSDRLVPELVSGTYQFTQLSAANEYSIGLAVKGLASDDDEGTDPPYDPGVDECGTGGSGDPVCEDFSPPADDPVWNGFVPVNVSGFNFWNWDDVNASLPPMGLKMTGWSSRAITNTGERFSYACFQATNGVQNWMYLASFGVTQVFAPEWVINLDVVPRAGLFNGIVYPYVDDVQQFSTYPRNPSETTAEKDFCVRYQVSEPLEEGTQYQTQTSAQQGVFVTNSIGEDKQEAIWLYTITPQAMITGN